MIKNRIEKLRKKFGDFKIDGYYNSVGCKDKRILFLEDMLYETEIEYNTLYNEYMRLRIKMKKND